MRMPISVLLLISLLIIFGGCSADETRQPISDTRLLLDTFCTITIYEPLDMSILEEAFDMCEEYEAMFSRTLEGSDIWQINNASGSPVTVNPQTAALISAGLEIGYSSDGMFDITTGRLSSLWDFGGDDFSVPTESDLETARTTANYRLVTVTDDTVQLANAETWLDLGGIAKGYIADRLAEFLKERGVKGAVIDLGGDTALIGVKPDGTRWRIGVRNPFGDSREVFGVVTTAEAAVVSSGIFERQFMEDGIHYHHILEPLSGFPARSDVVGVTLITESATVGDAYSTALIIAGSERAHNMLEQIPGFIGALLALDDGALLKYGSIDFQ